MREGAMGIILRNGKILLGKRLKGDSFQGLWCNFGGEIETGETALEALQRELNEELGIDVGSAQLLTVIDNYVEFGTQGFRLHYHLVRDWKGEIVNRSEHSEVKWFSFDMIKDLSMGGIGKKIIEKHLSSDKVIAFK